MEHQINRRVVVIGGVNMDIGGSPAAPLVLRDSNPGVITVRPGGVGRNIAHDLRLLGLEVALIAAVGGDVYGAGLMESCSALGMDMSMARFLPERRSSTYLYVTDEKGDMELAISDMDITKCITPEYLAPFMERINQAAAVVLDANLEEETIRFLAERCTVPVYADPVSTAKAVRLRGVLGRLYGVKPNAIEAETLTGEREAEAAARAMVRTGVKRAFVSLGADGVIAAEGERLLHAPCVSTDIVNTTGAGDAATAAIVWAGVMGLGLEETVKAAMKAGAITAQCREANNPALSEAALRA